MDGKLVIAILSGVVALSSAALGLYNQQKLANLKYKFDLNIRELDKKEAFEKLLSKYRDPLIRATCDFQSRIYNIIQNGFLNIYYNRSERDKGYAINNTLFVTAEFLGWIEIIRREIQFLDLGENNSTKQFNELIENITDIFLSDGYDLTCRLLRGEQRAIGEIMIEKTDDRLYCIGYAQFKKKMEEDKDFSFWFETLIASIEDLVSTNDSFPQVERLILLQHSLIDLIDFLDTERIRVSENRRSKIESIRKN